MTQVRCKARHTHQPCHHTFNNIPKCRETCADCRDELYAASRAKREQELAVAEAESITSQSHTARTCYSCGSGPIAGDPMFDDMGGGFIHRSCAG